MHSSVSAGTAVVSVDFVAGCRTPTNGGRRSPGVCKSTGDHEGMTDPWSSSPTNFSLGHDTK